MLSATERLLGHLKALADPVRLRLFVLCANGECSVSELRAVTGLSQPRVSQHLKTLSDAGLIERFRDGQFVYYRAAKEGAGAGERRRLLSLVPEDEPDFAQDLERLCGLRGEPVHSESGPADRALYRALVELTVSAPLGDLLDIGSGEGRVLKLLASRARRAVGVDTNPDARRQARADLLLAGLPNCTVRQGSMYQLPFDDESFDTIILDDVLGDAVAPADSIGEARRLLRPGGRLLVLGVLDEPRAHDVREKLAAWCRALDLRVAAPRVIPASNPAWLLAVATRPADRAEVA